MFTTLGRHVHRRRRLVLIAWLAFVVAGSVIGGQVMGRLSAEAGGGDRLESARVFERLDELVGLGGEVVGVVDGVDLDDPATRAQIEAAHRDLIRLDGVVDVLDLYSTGSDAFRSLDGRATMIVVTVGNDLSVRAEHDLIASVGERLRAIDAPSVSVGGTLVMYEQFAEAVERDLQRGELVALPIAFVVMVVIFGGLMAAGLPLLVALGAVAGSMFVLFTASGVTDVSIFALNVVTMLGIGLGIDYGLLVISRFREERAAGADIAAAVERTVATAGATVAFSALTVAVALFGLFVFGEPTLTSFGIAGIGVVLTAMVAATTLLPALLAVLGRRIKPARVVAADHGRFYRLARRVQGRALPVALVVGVGLAALALPFAGARFENGDARSLPRSSEARAVALTLGERFPARGADPVTVIADVAPASPAAAAYVEELAGLPGVAGLSVHDSLSSTETVIDVVPVGTGQGERARELVRSIRGLEPGFTVEVGGSAAYLIDFSSLVAQRLPWALGLIAVATLALLFLMTGSIAIPLKAIAMNVLSLGASFGALVWIFQDGNLSGLLGFDPVGSVDLFMPILVFIFAFGLSMDYEVFLLSRVKELHDAGVDNDTAVALGLQRTGRIITSAALLIVIVFAGFAAGEVLTIKQLGVGLALAVIVDATVVRSLLVPATMKLLGEWNWWAPAPLRRLHDRIGIHEPPSMPVTAVAAPATDADEPVLEAV